MTVVNAREPPRRRYLRTVAHTPARMAARIVPRHSRRAAARGTRAAPRVFRPVQKLDAALRYSCTIRRVSTAPSQSRRHV
ncbi:hypothetical protein NX847_31085, partial [Burkholderia thailandensis]|uniref:hypothetical protein n=1 Tax=Burkholderia thailandensis TaxID=57975 RepID=UPI00217E9329